MLRNIAQVRTAAQLVAADLRRVLGPTWSCEVDDALVLTVSGGAVGESVLLECEVQDEAWYVDETWEPERQSDALAVDATETVASEVVEILRALGGPVLECHEHGQTLSSCESVWYCDGPPGQDAAFVGRLGTESPLAAAEDEGTSR